MQHQHYTQARLSRPAYLLLASLAYGPRQVIALQEAIEQAEGFSIEPGTLYRVLAYLEQRGLIEGLHAEGPLRHYRLTALGILALESAEASRQREKPKAGGRPLLLRGKEIIMRLVIWMLRLYPPAWRERYEAEMVALLEHYEVTPWTVLDLLIGALDARLDSYYRGLRQLHPWKRLQLSWKVMGSASIAFGLAISLWFADTWDLGNSPDTPCGSPGYYYPRCHLRVEVTVLSHPVSNAIESILGTLALILSLVFLAILVVWVLSQMKRKPGRNLLRLLSLIALIPLLQVLTTGPWWTLVIAVPCVALVVESGGALLASGCKIFYHVDEGQRTAKRGRAKRDVIGLTLALSILVILLLMRSGLSGPFLVILAPQMVIACVTLVGEALLASSGRAVSHANEGQRTAKRGRAIRDVIGLVLALSVSVSIVLLLSHWWEGGLVSLWYVLPALNLFFLATLAGWVLRQMTRKPVQNSLRLLSLVVLFLLQQAVWNSQWWEIVITAACVALAGECVGALLASSGRTFSHTDEGQRTAKRGRVMRDVISLVFALSISVSMVLLCIAQGADLVAWWNLFPHLNLYFPGTQIVLIVTFVGMVLATLTALVVFTRGAWALRAVYVTPPRPLQQAHEQG